MESRQTRLWRVEPQGGTFPGLSTEDRTVLSRWLAAARPAGIDAAEDLGRRCWEAPAADAIIGVFKPGHSLASWLIVGQGGCWAVACCADGGVSPSLGRLTDALSLVCPVGRTPGPAFSGHRAERGIAVSGGEAVR